MKHSRWEYRLVESIDESGLSELGAEGWELVSSGHPPQMVFKRPFLDFREQVTMDQRRCYFASWGFDIDAWDRERGA